MKRREFIKSIAFGAGAYLAIPLLSRAEERENRPNIVIIYVDDLGYGDTRCYGATKVKTPNIDRLAKEGRMFTDAHSASAVCTPSRYCLLTGEYAWRKGIWGPLPFTKGLLIGKEQMTIGKLFKQNGYATACIGKWHLGFGEKTPDWNGELKPGPLEVGFDYYFGIPVVSSSPPYVLVENHRVLGLDPADPLLFGEAAKGKIYAQSFPEKHGMDKVGGAKAAHALYNDEENGITLANKAAGWIRSQKDKPFFLYFATGHIHHPFTPNQRFKGTSECGLYGDYIHELDWMVGEVLRALDDTGAAKRTLVIFTSDNGGMLNEGGKEAWQAGHRMNGDLLGFKFGAWEGGHREPFIVRWPGRVQAGSRSNLLISSIDIMATIASVLGCKLKPDEGPDSFNVLPAILGDPEKQIRDHLIMAPHISKNLAIRFGKWVYIPAQGSGGFGNGLKELAFTGELNSDVTPDGDIKKGAPPAQLYDLESDPHQSTNVYNKYPEVVQELKALLEKYMKEGKSAPHSA